MKNTKEALRLEMLQARKELSASDKSIFNASLEEQAIELIEKLSPTHIHIYLSLKDEVETQGIIDYCWEHKILVLVPQVLAKGELRHLEYQKGDRLVKGSFQCKWPARKREHNGHLDLIICPGLAFSEEGSRLGYGGGYYDRFLVSYPNAWKVALALPFQIVEEIPSEPHDCRMNQILVASSIRRR